SLFNEGVNYPIEISTVHYFTILVVGKYQGVISPEPVFEAIKKICKKMFVDHFFKSALISPFAGTAEQVHIQPVSEKGPFTIIFKDIMVFGLNPKNQIFYFF
ncbi:hypothetical protein, partial [Winogradskyella poriferorum]|uniref:hypothetical protein n=1 Tax=Winogradskyella poriferorum TaxID=307627 RepID=UPI003D65924C